MEESFYSLLYDDMILIFIVIFKGFLVCLYLIILMLMILVMNNLFKINLILYHSLLLLISCPENEA